MDKNSEKKSTLKTQNKKVSELQISHNFGTKTDLFSKLAIKLRRNLDKSFERFTENITDKNLAFI